MRSLSEGSNLFGRVALVEPKKVADLLEGAGWRVRKAGFAEFEAIEEDAEMMIEGSERVLIHGSSSNPNVTAKMLADIFQKAHVRFLFEIYDSFGNLTKTITDE